jgi:hypothetical protein
VIWLEWTKAEVLSGHPFLLKIYSLGDVTATWFINFPYNAAPLRKVFGGDHGSRQPSDSWEESSVF